ncbi:MAG: N-6 DNA methylase [Sandaracinaceae bacterium]|nr:N-6 DNA methylase [Sandaracinaceae bacterium]
MRRQGSRLDRSQRRARDPIRSASQAPAGRARPREIRGNKAGSRTRCGKEDDDVLRVLEAHAARGTQVASARRFVIQPGEERRRTSSHYTPRELSEPIVRRTLEPLFAVMGEIPSSARILNLKVCDPAMGSGAFLVEACRYLGDRLVRAWTHEGVLKDIAAKHGDPVLHARRLVAQRCLYGVDKNEYAVGLAKLSLWLVTLAKDLPFTFLDHALRHGDSLVGLDFAQIRAFHWKPKEQLETVTREISSALGGYFAAAAHS